MVTVPSAYTAALCAGAAVWLCVAGGPGARRRRLLFAASAGLNAGAAPHRRWVARSASPLRRWLARPVSRFRPEWLCLAAGAGLALLGDSPLPLLAGAAGIPLVGRRLRARARAGERDRRADAVIDLCATIAAELRAGSQPAQALCFAARATGALGDDEPAVVAAARFGGDVPEALRGAAAVEGAEGLAGLGACWQVAVDGGAGLAAGLDRLEAALRERREERERLRAQLSGAWATVVLLALLPVAGLAMGAALGAGPLRVLLHTPAGLACLVVGGALEAAGLWWAGRIVRAGAEP